MSTVQKFIKFSGQKLTNQEKMYDLEFQWNSKFKLH